MNLKVLFVDDEANVLHGLQRMLYPLRQEWDMNFCTTAAEALQYLHKKKFDVIVTDMRMPGMDGAQLLQKVKDEFPGVVRIILSGYSEKDSMIKISNIAHQFLAKPCDANSVKTKIERIWKLQQNINNANVLKIVTGSVTLPSLPELYTQLENELQSSVISLKKIGDVIARDVTMTAKILQMVNSAFFGLPQTISSPYQAVNFLGVDMIKSLVLFQNIFSSFTQNPEMKQFIELLWKHSFKVAHVSKAILKTEICDPKQLDQAFTAGLLHDLGKLILIKIPGYVSNVTTLVVNDNVPLYTAEEMIYKTNHSAVGAYLLGLWGLSEPIVEAAAFHHHPSDLADNSFSALTSVHIANSVEIHSKIDEEYIVALNIKDKMNTYKEIINGYEEFIYE